MSCFINSKSHCHIKGMEHKLNSDLLWFSGKILTPNLLRFHKEMPIYGAASVPLELEVT